MRESTQCVSAEYVKSFFLTHFYQYQTHLNLTFIFLLAYLTPSFAITHSIAACICCSITSLLSFLSLLRSVPFIIASQASPSTSCFINCLNLFPTHFCNLYLVLSFLSIHNASDNNKDLNRGSHKTCRVQRQYKYT